MYDVAVYQGAEALMNRPLKIPGISNTSDGSTTRSVFKALCWLRIPPRLLMFFLGVDSSQMRTAPNDFYPDEKQNGYWDDGSNLSHQQQRQPALHSAQASDSDETLYHHGNQGATKHG